MKNEFHLHPPLVIRVGNGHWKPPKSVTLETEWYESGKNQLQYRRFTLLMDDTVLYQGGGYGIERFGEYVTSPNDPPEIQLIPELLIITDSTS